MGFRRIPERHAVARPRGNIVSVCRGQCQVPERLTVTLSNSIIPEMLFLGSGSSLPQPTASASIG